MDQLTALKVFAKVVETESFARAAELLQMPRSTVSKMVMDLENHLGAALLQCTTRQLKITPEGKTYYRHATKLLEALECADNAVRQYKQRLDGSLHLAAPALIAQQWLIPRITRFQQDFPDLKISLTISDQLNDVIADGLDCLIRAGSLYTETMIGRKLGDFAYVTCASPAYLAQYGTPRDPHGLSHHRTIGYLQHNGQAEAHRYHKGGQRLEYSSHQSLCNDGTGLIALAKNGAGICQVLRPLVQDALDGGALAEILPGWSRPALPLSVVYPAAKHRNLRLQTWLEWLLADVAG